MSVNKGLGFFPLAVDIWDDDKIEFVLAKHGNLAEIVIVRLLQKIYRNSYYTKWNDDDAVLLSARVNKVVDEEYILTVVQELIDRNFFNAKMYKKHKILTSKKIQETYKYGTKRRTNIDMSFANCLQDDDDSDESANKNDENVDNNSKNDNDSEQTKLNETKRNENELPDEAHPMRKYVHKYYSHTIGKLEEQLTDEQCIALMDVNGKWAATREESETVFLDMHNKYETIKKNKTVYGTFITFLKNQRTNFGRKEN